MCLENIVITPSPWHNLKPVVTMWSKCFLFCLCLESLQSILLFFPDPCVGWDGMAIVTCSWGFYKESTAVEIWPFFTDREALRPLLSFRNMSVRCVHMYVCMCLSECDINPLNSNPNISEKFQVPKNLPGKSPVRTNQKSPLNCYLLWC